MKKLTKELKDKSVKELEKQAQAMREELAKLQLNFAANMPKDTNQLQKKKKQLAVVLTLLTEKRELEIKK